MTRALRQAVNAPEVVRALRGYGLTRHDIAAIAGVSDQETRRWSRPKVSPTSDDVLVALRSLVLLLSDSLAPQGVGQWLHARNRRVSGARKRSPA